jgi:hypothetical protein
VSRICAGSRRRQQVRAGTPARSLTANAGLVAVTELCGRLDVIGALDAAVGPVKQRDRGFGAGELLTGIAAAQLAGEDFLAGLDRQSADAAGQQITLSGARTRVEHLSWASILGARALPPRIPRRVPRVRVACAAHP